MLKKMENLFVCTRPFYDVGIISVLKIIFVIEILTLKKIIKLVIELRREVVIKSDKRINNASKTACFA